MANEAMDTTDAHRQDVPHAYRRGALEGEDGDGARWCASRCHPGCERRVADQAAQRDRGAARLPSRVARRVEVSEGDPHRRSVEAPIAPGGEGRRHARILAGDKCEWRDERPGDGDTDAYATRAGVALRERVAIVAGERVRDMHTPRRGVARIVRAHVLVVAVHGRPGRAVPFDA